MKAGWRDAPLALRDSVVSNMHNLLTSSSNLPTRGFNHSTLVFSLLTGGFDLVTRGFEHVTHRFGLVTCGFEVVTR